MTTPITPSQPTTAPFSPGSPPSASELNALAALAGRRKTIRGVTGPHIRVLVNETDHGTAIRAELDPSVLSTGFFAKITGHTTMSGWTNAWAYSWQEVAIELSSTGPTLVAKSGGRTGNASNTFGSDQGPAINIYELGHGSQYSWHVDANGADYPAGFIPLAVGAAGTTNTHRYDPVVWMREARTPIGQRLFYFQASAGHDGTCT